MTIREARKKAGLTQAVLAKCLGVSKRTVEEWENGKHIPQGGEDDILEKIQIINHLTSASLSALIDGDLAWGEAVSSYRYHQVRKLSKWGELGDTFYANWSRIPEGIVATASAEALAELVDNIKAAYDDGVRYGKEKI